MCYQPSDATLKAGQTKVVHKFELAGLGKAPFRFAGMDEKVIVHADGTTQAGSSCDFCSTGIRYQFWCESADGKTFKVGCDCIHKSGDAGLVKMIAKAERELKDKKNQIARERKSQRKSERFANAKVNLPKVAGELANQPHPNAYFASQGKTLLEYVQWSLDNQNETGCFYIERQLKGENE